MVVAAVPTFADVPAADGNPVMEPAAAMAADENAVMEPTAVMEAIAATCGEFRYEIEVQHGCRNSTHPDAYSITFVRQRLFFTSIQCFGWSGR